MTPTLYRYRDSESVIRALDGYTPGEGWEPLYSQAQVDKELTMLSAEVDQLQAQLVRQQASYEAEIKVEIDVALERAAAEVVLLDKKHWFSKQSRFAEFLAYAIRALKESKE